MHDTGKAQTHIATAAATHTHGLENTHIHTSHSTGREHIHKQMSNSMEQDHIHKRMPNNMGKDRHKHLSDDTDMHTDVQSSIQGESQTHSCSLEGMRIQMASDVQAPADTSGLIGELICPESGASAQRDDPIGSEPRCAGDVIGGGVRDSHPGTNVIGGEDWHRNAGNEAKDDPCVNSLVGTTIVRDTAGQKIGPRSPLPLSDKPIHVHQEGPGGLKSSHEKITLTPEMSYGPGRVHTVGQTSTASYSDYVYAREDPLKRTTSDTNATDTRTVGVAKGQDMHGSSRVGYAFTFTHAKADREGLGVDTLGPNKASLGIPMRSGTDTHPHTPTHTHTHTHGSSDTHTQRRSSRNSADEGSHRQSRINRMASKHSNV
ncbi:hypothetical protein SARC_15548, partial [Sphaeroforma arctica JP610]